jgi:hypothetical protein
MNRRAWLISKNFLVHLFRGGEDRIAIEEHGKELPLEEADQRQRAIERRERRKKGRP